MSVSDGPDAAAVNYAPTPLFPDKIKQAFSHYRFDTTSRFFDSSSLNYYRW